MGTHTPLPHPFFFLSLFEGRNRSLLLYTPDGLSTHRVVVVVWRGRIGDGRKEGRKGVVGMLAEGGGRPPRKGTNGAAASARPEQEAPFNQLQPLNFFFFLVGQCEWGRFGLEASPTPLFGEGSQRRKSTLVTTPNSHTVEYFWGCHYDEMWAVTTPNGGLPTCHILSRDDFGLSPSS